MRADEILSQGAATFRERGKVYGANYLHYGKVLKALFPAGITLTTEADFAAFGNFLNCVLKTTRLASALGSGQGLHQDSCLDLSVYAAMALEVAQTEKVKELEAEALDGPSLPFNGFVSGADGSVQAAGERTAPLSSLYCSKCSRLNSAYHKKCVKCGSSL